MITTKLSLGAQHQQWNPCWTNRVTATQLLRIHKVLEELSTLLSLKKDTILFDFMTVNIYLYKYTAFVNISSIFSRNQMPSLKGSDQNLIICLSTSEIPILIELTDINVGQLWYHILKFLNLIVPWIKYIRNDLRLTRQTTIDFRLHYQQSI